MKHRPVTSELTCCLHKATIGIIDADLDYIEPVEGPADIADDFLPFMIDGMYRKALSAAQRAEFRDLWGKADVEDSVYILHRGILYSV